MSVYLNAYSALSTLGSSMFLLQNSRSTFLRKYATGSGFIVIIIGIIIPDCDYVVVKIVKDIDAICVISTDFKLTLSALLIAVERAVPFPLETRQGVSSSAFQQSQLCDRLE
uniref:Uncharacterized protein n=1 Tax=Anopheles coluzzii TaxID=1518534 RepID=A0A8W7P8J8_ANOCL